MSNRNKTRTIVTVVLTGVFSFLAVSGAITSDQYIPIYTMIVTFWFTSSSKEVENNDSKISKDNK